MQAEIFSCANLSEKIIQQVHACSQNFAKNTGSNPCLAVVLVGNDPASHVYVKKKSEACARGGVDVKDFILPEKTSVAELEALLQKLNSDKKINGILVQSPLPKHFDERKIQALIDPAKDVDGFHPQNAGALFIDTKKCLAEGLPPCTPAGVMEVFKEKNISLAGKHAVVIGRSTIVGKPMAFMLLSENATVTIAHSKTKNLAQECARADILVAAIGKSKFVTSDFIKKGAVVIDVGINRVEKNGKWTLAGDVDASSVAQIAALITPVPKGIGPMTIALLIRNTARAALQQHKLPLAI